MIFVFFNIMLLLQDNLYNVTQKYEHFLLIFFLIKGFSIITYFIIYFSYFMFPLFHNHMVTPIVEKLEVYKHILVHLSSSFSFFFSERKGFWENFRYYVLAIKNSSGFRRMNSFQSFQGDS